MGGNCSNPAAVFVNAAAAVIDAFALASAVFCCVSGGHAPGMRSRRLPEEEQHFPPGRYRHTAPQQGNSEAETKRDVIRTDLIAVTQIFMQLRCKAEDARKRLGRRGMLAVLRVHGCFQRVDACGVPGVCLNNTANSTAEKEDGSSQDAQKIQGTVMSAP